MPDLNLDVNYFDHIKTLRLIARLGDGAEILPIRLWAYCSKHHPEKGILKGYADSEIEWICKWRGEKGEMVAAMIEVGFLDRMPDNEIQVHNWLVREGHLVMQKVRAKHAAEVRWGYAPSNAQAMQRACSSNAQSDVSNALSIRTRRTSCTSDSNLTKTPPTKVGPEFSFEAIWNQYPSRTGKKAAEKSFHASVKTPQDYENIQKALTNYLNSKRVKDGYIQNGSTWFNDWQGWIIPEGDINAPHGSASPVSYRDRLRQQKEAERLRENFAAGEVPAGSGNMPDVSVEAESGSRR